MVTKHKIKYLSILLISVALTLTINLIIKNNKAEYNKTIETYNKMMSNLEHKEKYVDTIEKLNNQSTSNISKITLQEDIISILYGYAEKNNVNISTMSFEEETKTALDESNLEINDEYRELGLERENTNNTSYLGIIEVSIEFSCDLEDVLNFIDDIKNEVANLSANSLRYIPTSNSLITGVLNIKFYTST